MHKIDFGDPFARYRNELQAQSHPITDPTPTSTTTQPATLPPSLPSPSIGNHTSQSETPYSGLQQPSTEGEGNAAQNGLGSVEMEA